jgi:hypothetical protein
MTAFLTLFLGALAVMQVVFLLRMRSVSRHDRVLFPLCDLRREVMAELRREGASMSDVEYAEIMQMRLVLDGTIHHYHDLKASLFNFRDFVRFLRAYAQADGDVSVPASSERIDALRRRLALVMMNGFLTYTPLLKSEMIVRLAAGLAAFLCRLGVRQLRVFGSSLKAALDRFQEQRQFIGSQPALAYA